MANPLDEPAPEPLAEAFTLGGPRRRTALDPERRAYLDRQAALQAREVDALEVVAGIVHVDGDAPVAPVAHTAPCELDARSGEGRVLVDVRAMGSALRVVQRDLVAEGMPPARTIGIYVVFRGAAGVLRRTQGNNGLQTRAEVQAVRDALDAALAGWPEGSR